MSPNNIKNKENKKNKEEKESVFDQFTNKYSLQKTLRFELVPVGNTKQMLENERVFEKDEIIYKKYEQTKPFIDRLHKEFIKESLSNKKIEGLDDYFKKFEAYYKNKKDRDNKKNFQNKQKELRKILNDNFKTESLFSKKVFGILKEKYGTEDDSFVKDEDGNFVLDKDGERVSIFDEWKGFTGYFTKFQETRKNLYKDDGTATAIVTRIIDENLYRFCENIKLYESIKSKLDFSEVEKNFDLDVEDLFKVDYYNSCLLQDGIDKYNEILGGKTLENGEKLKGLNEVINKYRQDNKGEKIGFFKMLDKQILSDKEKSVFIQSINDDVELLGKLKEFYINAEDKTKTLKDLFNDFVNHNNDYDLSKIYINKIGINTILSKWFDSVGKNNFEKNIFEQNKKEKIIGFDKDSDSYKFPDFLALSYIKNALDNGIYETKEVWKERYHQAEDRKDSPLKSDSSISRWEEFLQIFNYEFNLLFVSADKKEGYDLFKIPFNKLIERNDKNFSVSSEDKIIIKNFVDNTLWIYQMAKYFAIEYKRKWMESEHSTDSRFYDNDKFGFKSKFYDDVYDKIVKERMLLQSYLTKKPFSTDKWKLNFDCGYLLNGWSTEFDTYASLLFEKDNQYYLGIVKGSSLSENKKNQLFKDITKENSARKLVYHFQKPDFKNVPRLFIRSKGENFAPAVKKYDLPVESIIEVYDRGLFKTENKENSDYKESLTKMIDYFKLGFSKHESYRGFVFKWLDSNQYNDISEFYDDTIRSCYELAWENINFDELTALTETSDIYLFRLHNKDFARGSQGLNNLHTLYFVNLFSQENLNNINGVILNLSGQGEIFFRPKTTGLEKNKIITKYNKIVLEKGDRAFNKKRYTEDKIFLHFPVSLN